MAAPSELFCSNSPEYLLRGKKAAWNVHLGTVWLVATAGNGSCKKIRTPHLTPDSMQLFSFVVEMKRGRDTHQTLRKNSLHGRMSEYDVFSSELRRPSGRVPCRWGRRETEKEGSQ